MVSSTPTVKMEPFLCANQHQGDGRPSCTKEGTKACSVCKLVLYCSKECQVAHWSIHKVDCNSPLRNPSWKPAWEVEHRAPTFLSGSDHKSVTSHGGKKYLWGSVPAIDLLQLAKNEGKNTTQDLHLLLAASGDLRNLVKTLACVPDGYQGHIKIDVNDKDQTVVARNILIILIALNFPPEIASDMVIHLWYSAFLTESIIHSITNTILPIIQNGLKSRKANAQGKLRATWTYQKTQLSAELDRKTWNLLLAYCQGNQPISFDDAARLRKSVTVAPSRQDYRERATFALPRSWRVARAKFREDGILLPFGAPRGEFKVPNPWKLGEVLEEPHHAKDDLYGLLYLHVRQFLLKFCERLHNLKLNVSLFCMDALNLPSRLGELHGERRYDRIEVSNIADCAYLGPIQTIGLYGPLLRHPARNPKATLITLFLNAAHEMSNTLEQRLALTTSYRTLQQFLPLNLMELIRSGNTNSAEFLNFINARDLVSNNEPAFRRYMEAFQFKELGKAVGVEMKLKHTIVGKWPMRLPKRPTKREFELLYWSGLQGSERYVEWCKIR